MKVSLPVSALLTFGGLGYFISELIRYSEVGETSVLLILTGLIVFFFCSLICFSDNSRFRFFEPLFSRENKQFS